MRPLQIIFTITFIIITTFGIYKLAYSNTIVDYANIYQTKLNNEIYEKSDESKNLVPIIVYHHISDASKSKNFSLKKYSVSSAVFEQQMKFLLDSGYTPVTIHQLITLEKENNLPFKPISITFDDGWLEQYSNALPILIKYKIPATFYITNGQVGGKDFMTWADIQDLVSNGMEIGGHTVNHPHLEKLTPDKAYKEIKDNKDVLEKKLNTQLHDFAYPYGTYNSQTINAVEKAEYETARSSIKTYYNDFKSLFELRAIYASPDLESFKKLI